VFIGEEEKRENKKRPECLINKKKGFEAPKITQYKNKQKTKEMNV